MFLKVFIISKHQVCINSGENDLHFNPNYLTKVLNIPSNFLRLYFGFGVIIKFWKLVNIKFTIQSLRSSNVHKGLNILHGI